MRWLSVFLCLFFLIFNNDDKICERIVIKLVSFNPPLALVSSQPSPHPHGMFPRVLVLPARSG